MIRDRLVVGIKDAKLSEALQLDPDLTLEKTKTKIRQKEAVLEQQKLLNTSIPDSSDSNTMTADEIRSSYGRDNFRGCSQGIYNQQRAPECSRCGKEYHQRSRCPARDAICQKCKKRGHFSSKCFSKTSMAEVEEEEGFLDTLYLDAISAGEGSWIAEVRLNGRIMVGKMDTGAEVTAITEKTYKDVGSPKLHPPVKRLCGPSHQPLNVLGKFSGTLSCNDKSSTHTIYVLRNLKTNLIGLPAITSLRMATRIDSVSGNSKDQWKDELPEVFKGLGVMGEPYDIQLKPHAKPSALYTARHIPIPLRGKVLQELQNMEATGIIWKVEKHTPWCAGMVVEIRGSPNLCRPETP